MCGGIEHIPAKLELYVDSTTEQILFTNVVKVEYNEDQDKLNYTIIQNDENSMTFHAESDKDTEEWFQCCMLLKTLPFCTIPEFPEGDLISEELIKQHNDPHRHNAGTNYDHSRNCNQILCVGTKNVLK